MARDLRSADSSNEDSCDSVGKRRALFEFRPEDSVVLLSPSREEWNRIFKEYM